VAAPGGRIGRPMGRFSPLYCTWNTVGGSANIGLQYFNQPSPEKFFFEFFADFSICCFFRPLKKGSKEFFFKSEPEVCFLGADVYDPLGLTGLRVPNFFIYLNFCLICLHRPHL
jgi:hypothetical protein